MKECKAVLECERLSIVGLESLPESRGGLLILHSVNLLEWIGMYGRYVFTADTWQKQIHLLSSLLPLKRACQAGMYHVSKCTREIVKCWKSWFICQLGKC